LVLIAITEWPVSINHLENQTGGLFKRKKKLIKKQPSQGQVTKQLFGVKLEELHPKYLHPNGIPLVIELTCSQIEKNGNLHSQHIKQNHTHLVDLFLGATTEGIFRISGSHGRVTELSEIFDQSECKHTIMIPNVEF
jgi:hypothetical protein